MSERGPGRPAGAAGQPQGREAILQATRDLLVEHGTQRVTLRMVADRAGVRAPLVHYYFGSKAELFEAVIEEVAGRLRERLKAISAQSDTPQERFREYISGMIHIMAEDPFTPRLMAELVIFPDDERTDRFTRDFGGPNIAALGRILQDGVASGAFGPLDPRLLAPAVLGVCIFYFLGAPALRRLMDFEPFDPESVDRYAAYAGELLLNGIAARPSREPDEEK